MVLPTNNIVNTRAAYDVIFTTGTTGKIGQITITFAPGFDFFTTPPIVIEHPGVAAGVLTETDSRSVRYTLNPAVSIPAGTTIRLEFSNILNPSDPAPAFGDYFINVATRDSFGNLIDGPVSSRFTLTAPVFIFPCLPAPLGFVCVVRFW